VGGGRGKIKRKALRKGSEKAGGHTVGEDCFERGVWVGRVRGWGLSKLGGGGRMKKH